MDPYDDQLPPMTPEAVAECARVGDLEATVTTTPNQLYASILVGMAGENGPVPSSESIWRTVGLIVRVARRTADQ